MTKVVLLTGGSRGLGLAVSERLLVKGWRVSSCGRTATADVGRLKVAYPETYRFTTADVTNPDGMRTFVDGTVEHFGPPWALVNNAAIAVEGVLATLPEVEIARMIAVNLEGSIRLARMTLRQMLRQRDGGRIINISSIVGTRGYNGLSVYSATKAGLDGFTRALAREVGRRGITVNSVAPGYMETDMSAGLGTSELNQIIRRTPMGRLATVDDVFGMLEFLLSDASSFVTGTTLLVDGGISS